MEETLAEYNKAREYFEKFKYIPGGHNLLAVKDKLKILPTEKLETYETDNSNLREDALLEIISQGKNPFELAVYGSTHDFNDNIRKWNIKYPDKKYSLIEITPNGLYK